MSGKPTLDMSARYHQALAFILASGIYEPFCEFTGKTRHITDWKAAAEALMAKEASKQKKP